MIKFAYIPRDEHRISADTQTQEALSSSKRSRVRSPDYTAFIAAGPSGTHSGGSTDEEEHVLVLEFASKEKGKKAENPAFVAMSLLHRELFLILIYH